MTSLSRRSLLKFASISAPLQFVRLPSDLATPGPSHEGSSATVTASVTDGFPSHPPELVREMVTVSHFDEKRVRELVDARPALARAAWDWGFGDWETALGAASHMGNRRIAEYLITNGARPSLFSAAMLGQLDVVKAFVAAQPGVHRIRGPHSISLVAHARSGGPAARPVLDFLQTLEGAGDDAEVPLSESDRALILGTYVFGAGPSQQVDVTTERNRFLNTDQLTWTRKGTMGRPLYHLGNRVFWPAGAPAVRIRFAEEANGMMAMTVHDPDQILAAQRRKP